MRLIMRSIAVAALLLCAQAASAETFEDFVRHFGRTYASKEAEEVARHNFEKTAARVKELQAANPLARFSAMTPVADRDFSTKRRPRSPHHDRLHQLRRDSVQAALAEQTNTPVPTLVDWREKGAVSPVGNMGQCSDSAGFVIDDVAEGALFIANGGTLVQLAHRQMRECYTHCDGAWAKDVVDKIVARGGALYTNASFVNDDCDGSQGSQIGCILTSYVPIPPTSGALARAVAYQGPIGVAIYAMDWMTYIGGVMTNCGNSTRTDPADDYATVVGYNDEVAPPYWIIKNSWGVEWGENGYIYVARHSDQCVIHTAPFLLTVQNPGH